MQKLIVGAVAVGCLLLAGCSTEPAAPSESERTEAVRQVAGSVLSQRNAPGIAIAVIRDGQPAQKFLLGSADLTSNEPVSGSTRFQLASTTKIFSSTAVLLLVAQGKIELDAPIGGLLDDLPAGWRAVTVRQLLSHTSGLPDITRTAGTVDLLAADWASALPIVAARPFQFQPGHQWSYTQTNYALLQRLIEKMSGRRSKRFWRVICFGPWACAIPAFPTSSGAARPATSPARRGRWRCARI